mmetsp:Transcript_38362/g.44690  ORF Transcript_38362/g.44690 Transcript_38362/m.44690 type:complete len:131 (+) Transcript_38362:43-435(+)
MTDSYWQNYKEKYLYDPRDALNFWQKVKKETKVLRGPTRQLDLFTYCTADNPMIMNLSKLTHTSSAAEVFCKKQACELQACLMLVKNASGDLKTGLNSQECNPEYSSMDSCILRESGRIYSKEHSIRGKF